MANSFRRCAAGTGRQKHSLQLRIDENHAWWQDGRQLKALDGCLDIDLSLTPATNTLPIRRLKLAPGERRSLKAARLRFPELKLSVLPQAYTQLGEQQYRYESLASSFSAVLQVEDLGLFIDYGDYWQRVAVADR